MTNIKVVKHIIYFLTYHRSVREELVAKNKERRAFLKSKQPPKTPSEFQQEKQKCLLKLLVNHRSFVPVPTKLKHPIIKN